MHQRWLRGAALHPEHTGRLALAQCPELVRGTVALALQTAALPPLDELGANEFW